MTVPRRHAHPRLAGPDTGDAGGPALAWAEATRVADETWVLRLQFRRNRPAPRLLAPDDLQITQGEEGRRAPFEIVEVLGPVDHVASVELVPAEIGPPLDRAAPFRVVLDPSTGVPPEQASARFRIGWAADLDDDTPEPPPPLTTYQAKDYNSFRALMLDQLAQSAPEWVERNPADLGVLLVELLAAAGDQLSYQQDAVATEATLHSARLRTSVRRHARLLDYALHDGCSARTWLHLQVDAPAVLEAGAAFCTGPEPFQGAGDPRARWDAPQTVFETVHRARLSPDQNRVLLWGWGKDRWVLGAGTWETALLGHVESLRAGDVLVLEPVDAGREETTGRVLLRHAVRLSEAPRLTKDGNTPITVVRWFREDALPFDLHVAWEGKVTTMVARGNLVLADEGGTRVLPGAALASRGGGHLVVRLRGHRLAASEPWVHAALAQPATGELFQDPRAAVPAITLHEARPDGAARVWEPRRDLMGSGPFDRHFVPEIDDRGDVVLRFGDGIHGLPGPDPRLVEVHARFGTHQEGNVAADTVIYPLFHTPWLKGVRNPLAARGGLAGEPVSTARTAARDALRVQERCLVAEDYAAAARSVGGVADAVAMLVWTGAWRTAVVRVMPADRDDLDDGLRVRVERHLLARRLLGTDVEVRGPDVVHLAISLRIGVAGDRPSARVAAAVREALGSGRTRSGEPGYFHRDAWTLGRDVYEGPMLARLAQIPGVVWCEVERFERRDPIPEAPRTPGVIHVRKNEVARLTQHGLALQFEVAS